MTQPESFDFMDNPRKQVLLQFFKDHPDKDFSLDDISKTLEIPKSSLSRALSELENLGFIDSKKEGRKKLYCMDKEMKRQMDETFKDLQRARTYALERRKEKIEDSSKKKKLRVSRSTNRLANSNISL